MYQRPEEGKRYQMYPKNLDREFRILYESPAWTCKCSHNYPAHRLCEVAWPVLVTAFVCWGCGTVLYYEDSTTANAVSRFENMVMRRPFVVRKGIASAPQAHGLARRTTPVVLLEMIKLGVSAGLSCEDLSNELGIDEKWIREFGGVG